MEKVALGGKASVANFDLEHILFQLTHITILKGNVNIPIVQMGRWRQREGRKLTS